MQHSVIHIFIFFLLFLCVGSRSYAQQLSSVNYTDENELPSNNVYYVFQDSKGYIWFATDKGVVKFDGKQFKTFTTSDGLADNECFDIYEDSKHRIWFASFNGEASFYYNDVFYSRTNCNYLKKINSKAPAFKIMEDKYHSIFYLTYHALYKLDSKNQWSRVQLKGFLFSTLYKDAKGHVCTLATNNNDSYIIDLFNFSKRKIPFDLMYKLHISSKSAYHRDQVYFFASTPFLSSMKDGSSKLKKIAFCDHDETIQFVSKHGEELYIGTQHGLYISGQNDSNFKHYFKTGSITSVIRDREDNLWVTTLNEGVYFVINPKMKLFNHRQFNFDKIFSISPLSDHSFFVGSDNFKSALVDRSKITPFSLNLDGQNYNLVVKNVKKIDKHYYFLTGARSIQFDENFKNPRDLLFAIKDMVLDANNFIITVGGVEIYKFPLSEIYTDNFSRTQRFRKSRIAAIKAFGIFDEGRGNYLVYGLFGVKKLVDDKLYNYSKHELLEKNIIDIERTDDGILWFASTVGGLIAVYKQQVYTFDLKNKLPSNYISSLSKGKSNCIWVGTNKGISRVSYTVKGNKLRIKTSNYSEQNGMVDDDIYDVHYQKDTVWIGTKKGLCFLHENDLKKKQVRPLLSVEKILVGKRKISEEDELIQVQADENTISFNIKGISFASFGNLKYKYRIVGLSKDWKTTSTEQIDLQSLAPGAYKMEIIAVDAFLNPSAKKSIRFEVLPYFYQTWWFRILLFFGAFTAIYFFTQFRLTKIKTNHELKEKLLTLENDQLKAQTKEISLQKDLVELEQKALMLQMNPHFIFNSINTIQALYKKERERADDYVVKFSTLLRQILEFSKMKTITLMQEIDFLSNYLYINKLRFENEFTYTIELAANILPNEIGLAPLIIQPFVENALLHGIQTLKKQGEIMIRFSIEGDYLVCEVEDNGVGRKRSAEINKNKIQESFGMEITKRRLDFHNNDKSVKSLIIEDLTDINGNALGTRVAIKMYMDEF